MALIAIGIAIKLNLQKMNNLLSSAGFALTDTDKFDLVIKFCLEKELYDVILINELLYDNGIQKLLGFNTNK